MWQAAGNTAKNITGDIAFSETKIAINFMAFPIASIRTLKPEEVAAVFDADVNTAGSGSLYRLNIPAAQRFLHKNTLCGTENTQWMASLYRRQDPAGSILLRRHCNGIYLRRHRTFHEPVRHLHLRPANLLTRYAR